MFSWIRSEVPGHRMQTNVGVFQGESQSGAIQPRQAALGDVERAGAQAAAVEHGFGVRLLLPEPVGRAGRREALEEAHGGGAGRPEPGRKSPPGPEERGSETQRGRESGRAGTGSPRRTP